MSNRQLISLAPEPLHAALETVRRNLDLEVRLIDDLLDVTRIARRRLALARERVNIHVLLQDVVDMLGEEARLRDIRVETGSRRPPIGSSAIRPACGRCSGICSATPSSSPTRADASGWRLRRRPPASSTSAWATRVRAWMNPWSAQSTTSNKMRFRCPVNPRPAWGSVSPSATAS